MFDVEIQLKNMSARKTVERIVPEGHLLSLRQSADVLKTLIVHYILMELVENRYRLKLS